MTRSALLVLLAIAVAQPASAEMYVGILAGTPFPGRQDVTVKEFGDEGNLISRIQNRSVIVSGDEFIGASLEVWRGGPRSLGIRLEALRWQSSFDLEYPAGQMTPVSQVHSALFVSLAGRVPLFSRGATAYGGLGGGFVDHRIQRLDQNTGGAAGVLAGIAVGAFERMRIRLDLKYLITADLDAIGTHGVRIETSGSRGAVRLFGPHRDTRFYLIALGLDWRL